MITFFAELVEREPCYIFPFYIFPVTYFCLLAKEFEFPC